MLKVIRQGLFTGLVLQLAIGPVFFYIMHLTLKLSPLDGVAGVLGAMVADYIYIAAAILGVGSMLEKGKVRHFLGLVGSLVLLLFGAFMIISAFETGNQDALGFAGSSHPASSFLGVFFLTLSSPLTILFWSGLFAARAVERNYTRRELAIFGFSAGLMTLAFNGLAVGLVSLTKGGIPQGFVSISNILVGALLVFYAFCRFYKTYAK